MEPDIGHQDRGGPGREDPASGWEQMLVPGWTVDDLDLDLLRKVAGNPAEGMPRPKGDFNPEESLGRLGLIDNGRLLCAAAILFGKDERLDSDFPQSLIRFARFKGTDKREFLDNRQFHGNAFSQYHRAQVFLIESTPIAGRIEQDSMYRTDIPLYPPAARREALANAICHRDYSIWGGSIGVAVYDDRMEVTSPGALPPGLTEEQLLEPHEPVIRNPLIANVLRSCGIVELKGRGTLSMKEQVAESGLPALEISGGSHVVTVRIRNGNLLNLDRRGISLSGTQAAILDLFPDDERALPLREIVARLPGQVGRGRLRDDLRLLKMLGILDVAGRGKGALWRRHRGR